MLFYSFLSVLDTEEKTFVEQLFTKYKGLIYDIAYSVVNNHEDAEDVLDEVMISIIKNIERFHHAGRNDIERQLVIYSRNRAINFYNKNKRKAKKESHYTYMNDDDEYEEIEFEDTGADVEEHIITREMVEIVHTYLMQLNAGQRDLVKLIYAYGYSNVEVARALGITPNAVGLRLFKIKKKLKQMKGGELREYI